MTDTQGRTAPLLAPADKPVDRSCPLDDRWRVPPRDEPASLIFVAYQIVNPASMTAGPGPHPAASPFDKRISEHLGIRAFEVYQVELPPGEETVRHHHLDDRVEDVYAILCGEGWLLVDEEQVPLSPGQFVAVSMESVRQVRAGDDGLVFIALCGAPH